MITYTDLLIENLKIREKYLKNLDYYLKKIKKFFKEQLKEVKIYLFGSYIKKKKFGPNSDIDILVISPNAPTDITGKAKLISKLKDKIGRLNPFEIHIVTPELYENWYKKFIKKDFKEI